MHHSCLAGASKRTSASRARRSASLAPVTLDLLALFFTSRAAHGGVMQQTASRARVSEHAHAHAGRDIRAHNAARRTFAQQRLDRTFRPSALVRVLVVVLIRGAQRYLTFACNV